MEEMKKHHELRDIQFTDENLIMTIDGETRRFRLAAISCKLANASETERNRFEISPSGYGLHWPLLDEDLSIDGLLGIRQSPNKTSESVES
jgi:hypothetical protein